jgi:2-C-methyl-D-erythritol 4-phosphate cytidylyltransferase/2-C-methyl-D-erythritol 2,4-cyclodiphosphate synthase
MMLLDQIFHLKLLDQIKKEIQFNNCVVPAIQTADSVKQKIKGRVKNLKRENIYFMQTPQAFNYNELFKLQKNKSLEVTDDANLFVEAGKKIKIIKGELENKKITINSDINSGCFNKIWIRF